MFRPFPDTRLRGTRAKHHIELSRIGQKLIDIFGAKGTVRLDNNHVVGSCRVQRCLRGIPITLAALLYYRGSRRGGQLRRIVAAVVVSDHNLIYLWDGEEARTTEAIAFASLYAGMTTLTVLELCIDALHDGGNSRSISRCSKGLPLRAPTFLTQSAIRCKPSVNVTFALALSLPCLGVIAECLKDFFPRRQIDNARVRSHGYAYLAGGRSFTEYGSSAPMLKISLYASG